MIKKCLLLLTCNGCLLFAAPSPLPLVIDFNSQPWEIGQQAFNCAPEFTSFFLWLKKTYDIDGAVETGTYLGNTTVFFSLLFDTVHTIEIDPSLHLKATETFSNFPPVQCHLGSSEQVLKELLPSLENKRLLFYLDAHWQAHWPLLEELEEISKTHHDRCVIIIDDIKVPGRKDIPYDRYGSHECSFEYVKSHLDQVFTSYTIHYLIPKSKASRAKLVAIPN